MSPPASRTRPILVASICCGVIGYTVSQALGIGLLASYVVTVVVVFGATAAVLAYRGR